MRLVPLIVILMPCVWTEMVAMTVSVVLVTLAMEHIVKVLKHLSHLYVCFRAIYPLQILMSVLVGMIHVISMPHVSTLLVAMTVNVCQVSWEMDSIVQVIIMVLT